MRFQQRRFVIEDDGPGHYEVRILNVETGEATPLDVMRAPDDAPVSDWLREDAAAEPVIEEPVIEEPALEEPVVEEPVHEVFAGDDGGGQEK